MMAFGEVEWKQEVPGRLWFFRRFSRRVGGQAAGGKETEGGQGVSCEGVWEEQFREQTLRQGYARPRV